MLNLVLPVLEAPHLGLTGDSCFEQLTNEQTSWYPSAR
jgi:hypothetical protein